MAKAIDDSDFFSDTASGEIDDSDFFGDTPEKVEYTSRQKPMSADQLLELERMYKEQAEENKEPSMIEEGLKGLAHGVVQLGADVGTGMQVAGGAVENALEGIGLKEDDGDDENGFTRLGETVQDYWDNVNKKFDAHKSLQGSVSENPELLTKGAWWLYNIGSFLPSLAASMIPAAGAYKGIEALAGANKAAKIALKAIEKGVSPTKAKGYKAINIGGKKIILHPDNIKKLAKFGGALTGGVVGGSLEGVGTYREMIEAGATPEEAREGFYAMTAASAGLNAISIGRFLTKLPKNAPIKKKLAQRTINALTEATTEWLEEPAEIAIKYSLGSETFEFTPEQAAEQMKASYNVLGPAFAVGLLMPVEAGRMPTEKQGEDNKADEDKPDEIKGEEVRENVEPETPEEKEAYEVYGEDVEEIVLEQPDQDGIEVNEIYGDGEEVVVEEDKWTGRLFEENEYAKDWSQTEKDMFDLLYEAQEKDPSIVDVVERMAEEGAGNDEIMMAMYNVISGGANAQPINEESSQEVQREPDAEPQAEAQADEAAGGEQVGQDDGLVEESGVTDEDLLALIEDEDGELGGSQESEQAEGQDEQIDGLPESEPRPDAGQNEPLDEDLIGEFMDEFNDDSDDGSPVSDGEKQEQVEPEGKTDITEQGRGEKEPDENGTPRIAESEDEMLSNVRSIEDSVDERGRRIVPSVIVPGVGQYRFNGDKVEKLINGGIGIADATDEEVADLLSAIGNDEAKVVMSTEWGNNKVPKVVKVLHEPSGNGWGDKGTSGGKTTITDGSRGNVTITDGSRDSTEERSFEEGEEETSSGKEKKRKREEPAKAKNEAIQRAVDAFNNDIKEQVVNDLQGIEDLTDEAVSDAIVEIVKKLEEEGFIDSDVVEQFIDDGKLSKDIPKSVINSIKRQAKKLKQKADAEKENRKFVAAVKAHIRKTVSEKGLNRYDRNQFIAGFRHAIKGGAKKSLPGIGKKVVEGYVDGQAFIEENGLGKNKLKNKDGGVKLRRHQDFRSEGNVKKLFLENVNAATARRNILGDVESIANAEASGGVLRMMDKIIDSIPTFTDWAGRRYGGSKRRWGTKLKDAISYEYDSDPGKIESDAISYIHMVNEIGDKLLSGEVKTLDELSDHVMQEMYGKTASERYSDAISYDDLNQWVKNNDIFDRREIDKIFNPRYATYKGLKETEDSPYSVEKRTRKARRIFTKTLVREGFEDVRNGRDITKEDIEKEFGFKQVFRGEYVNDKEWQEWLNRVYESLHDITTILGIPKKSMGIGGRLFLGIGALGKGASASAHFSNAHELDKVGADQYREVFGEEPPKYVPVINITKTMGNGAFFHEWTHALDFFLRGVYGEPMHLNRLDDATIKYPPKGMMSAISDSLRIDTIARSKIDSDQLTYGISWFFEPEMIDKRGVNIEDVKELISERIDSSYSHNYESDYLLRSKRAETKRNDPYWSNVHEMIARAAESYIYKKVHEVEGRENNWFVNESVMDLRWPTQKEVGDVIGEAFDHLFSIEGAFNEDGTPNAEILNSEELSLWFSQRRDSIIKEWKDKHLENYAEKVKKDYQEYLEKKGKADNERKEEDIRELEELTEQDDAIDIDEPYEDVFSDDEVDANDDDLLGEFFDEAESTEIEEDDSPVEVTASEAFDGLVGAAKNIVKGVAEITKPDRSTLGSNLGNMFTPEQYEKAKPYFKEAALQWQKPEQFMRQIARAIKRHFKYLGKLATLQEWANMALHFVKNDMNSVIRVQRHTMDRYYSMMEAGMSNPTSEETLRQMIADINGIPVSDVTDVDMRLAIPMIQAAAVKYIADNGDAVTGTNGAIVDRFLNEMRSKYWVDKQSEGQSEQTPIPLAYMLSGIYGLNGTKRILDSTAGRGSMLMFAEPTMTVANDINSQAAKTLKKIGLNPTTFDATTMIDDGKIAPESMDAVIAHPPTMKIEEQGGFEDVGEVIAANTLRAMKRDGIGIIMFKKPPSESMRNFMRQYKVDMVAKVDLGQKLYVYVLRGENAEPVIGGKKLDIKGYEDLYEKLKEYIPVDESGGMKMPEKAKSEQKEQSDGSVLDTSELGEGKEPEISEGNKTKKNTKKDEGRGESDEYQTVYPVRSENRTDDEIYAPAGMAESMQKFFDALEEEVGNIDEYAVEKLGYDSKEDMFKSLFGYQIDGVATAIYQAERGKAAIIADDTGVGKGRQAAAMIRYAEKMGYIPVFVTVKPNLYSAMHRDLLGVGYDLNPVITNDPDVYVTDSEGNDFYKDEDRKSYRKTMIETGRIPQGKNVVFTTYDQIGKSANSRRAIEAISDKAFFILDESHNAAGSKANGEESNVGAIIRSMLESSKGVTFLSATFAKNPDALALYSSFTDIGNISGERNEIINAIKRGKDPLATIAARGLAESGQIIKRQRSLKGITVPNVELGGEKASRMVKDYDELSAVVHALNVYSSMVEDEAKRQAIAKYRAENPEATSNEIPKPIYTKVVNKLFNITSQMLLSTKADAVADEVIASLKEGKKPVVGVMSTFGSFLDDYVAVEGLKDGDEMTSFNWAAIADRIFESLHTVTMSYGSNDPRNFKSNIDISLITESNLEIKEAHDNVVKAINKISSVAGSMSNSSTPVSPLDWIAYRVKKAGYDIGEITGRNYRAEYTDKGVFLKRIPASERKNKVAIQNKFQNNKNMALTINVSGSTGIDLHSGPDAADKSQRKMFIIEPHQDVNIFVQMMGRVNRYGQASVPEYAILRSPIPAEERLFSLISQKMRKLGANTSGSTKSRQDIETPDFMNAIGDKAVMEWISSNQELISAYSDILPVAEGGGVNEEGIARKLSGRIGIMPVSLQRAFYNDVSEIYLNMVDELRSIGEYTEEKDLLDYRAVPMGAIKNGIPEEVLQGGEGDSAFDRPAYLRLYRVKLLKKPYTRAQAAKRMLAALNEDGQGILGKPSYESMIDNLMSKVESDAKAMRKRAEEEVQKLLDKNTGDISPSQKEANQRRIRLLTNRIDSLSDSNIRSNIRMLRGKFILADGLLANGSVPDYTDENAVVMSGRVFEFTHKSTNRTVRGVVSRVKSKFKPTSESSPFAASNFQIQVETNSESRTMVVPLSQVMIDKKYETHKLGEKQGDEFIDGFETEDSRNGMGTERIVTGNIFGAMVRNPNMNGTIISFTDENGKIHDGLKLPASVDVDSLIDKRVALKDGKALLRYLKSGSFNMTAESASGIEIIYFDGELSLRVPGSSSDIKKFITNKPLGAVLADIEFQTSARGKKYRIYKIPSEREQEVVDALSDYVFLSTVSSRDDAIRANERSSGETAMHSRASKMATGAGMEADEVRSIMGDFVGILNKLGVPVRIYRTQYDALGERGLGIGRVKGAYDPDEGIVLIASNLKDRSDVLKTIRHEVFAHYGLRQLLGADFINLIKDVKKARKTNKRIDKLFKQIEELYPDYNPDKQAEEVIARIGEQHKKLPIYRKIINSIIRFLRNVGLYDGSVTISEIDTLIEEAGKNLRTGKIREIHRAHTYGPLHSRDFDSDRYKGYTEEEIEALREADSKEGWYALPFKDRMDLWWTETKHEFWRKVEQGLFDRFSSIKEFSLHGWKMARMAQSTSGIIEWVVKKGGITRTFVGGVSRNKQIKGLVEALSPLGDETKDFFRWMAAHRAAQLGRQGKENWLTPDDIKAWMKLSEGEMSDGRNRLDVYMQVKHDFMALHENILDYAQKAGVISAKERKTWNNEFYVPFFRLMDNADTAGVPMLDGLTGQTAYKRLKGAERQLGDLLGNVVTNWHHIISAAQRNDAARTIMQDAVKNREAVKVNKFSKGAVFVRENGKPVYYQIRRQIVFDAMTALTMSDADHAIMPLMRKAKRIFTLGVTSSPEFMVANLIRDTIHSAAVSKVSMNLLDNAITGFKNTKEDSEIFEKMLVGGGAIHYGYRYGSDPDAIFSMINKWRKEGTIMDGEMPNKMKNALRVGFEKWQDLGARFENTNRAALFAKRYDEIYKEFIKKNPKNPKAAAAIAEFEANFEARDLLDFSQHGRLALVRTFIQIIPFLNARLQGLHKLGRAFGDPTQKAQFLTVALTYAALSVALFLAYKDDDDFKKREEWDRDTYHWFKIPGTETAFRIPKPFEVGVIGTIAERIAEQLADDEVHGKLFFDRLMFALTQTFEFDPIPQLFRPVYNVATNKDPFTGRSIESVYMKSLPPEQRMSMWTSETSILAAKALSNIPWERVQLSPLQIDHLVRGYFGWVGAQVLSLSDLIAHPIGDFPDKPSRTISQMPLFGRFVRHLPEPRSKYVTMFYDEQRKVSEVYNAYRDMRKKGMFKEALAYRDKKFDLLKYHKRYASAQRQMSKISARIMQIRMSRKTDPDKKRKLIEELQQQKIKLAKMIAGSVQ